MRCLYLGTQWDCAGADRRQVEIFGEQCAAPGIRRELNTMCLSKYCPSLQSVHLFIVLLSYSLTLRNAAFVPNPHSCIYLADLAILSGLVYKSETVMTIISEATMYESSVAQYFAEKGIKQGIRESIQEVLELRFQPEAARLEAINDVQRLKQLHRAAIQVPSLEAFRSLLDEAE